MYAHAYKYIGRGCDNCVLVSVLKEKNMKEREIEQKLVREVRNHGGMCFKFVSPSNSGVPDRIVLFPSGRIAFIELKAPGEEPRPLQKARIMQLRYMGFRVYVISDPVQITGMLREMGDCHAS